MGDTGESKIMKLYRHLSGGGDATEDASNGSETVDGQQKEISNDDKSVGTSVDRVVDPENQIAGKSAGTPTAGSDVSNVKMTADGSDLRNAKMAMENAGEIICIGSCGKLIAKLGKNLVSITCYLCSQQSCNKCLNMTKAEAVKFGSDRADWHWTCESCLSKVGGGEIDPKLLVAGISDDAMKVKSIVEKSIEEVVVPKMIDQIQNSMDILGANITKQWSSLFGANDFPEYDPNISERQAKNIASAEELESRANREGILAGTLKKVQRECNKENADQELRKRTVIVYRVPEKNEKDNKKRKDSDMEEIEKLLEFINAPTKPQKSGRVGNFVPPQENEEPKSRPLRLVFNNHAEAKKVVDSASKLRNAPQESGLKSFSIDYDASKEQREEIRKANS